MRAKVGCLIVGVTVLLGSVGIVAAAQQPATRGAFSGAQAAVRGIRNIKNGNIKYRSLQEVFG